MRKVLVVGSINMDYVLEVNHLPHNGETILCSDFSLVCGGKGANQACTCAKLGIETMMLGAVGKDDNGDLLLKGLEEAGVNTEYVCRSDHTHSGMAFVSVNKCGENHIIVEQGANKEVTVDFVKQNIQVIDDVDIVILQLEIPIETVAFVAKNAKEKGKIVILDPAPAVKKLPEDLLKNIDLIKPNETELQIITGVSVKNMDDFKIAAKMLMDLGVPEVIVTLGDKGAIYLSQNDVRHFPGEKVDAVDTTAAGDSFTASLGYMLAKGHSIQESISFAIEISALVVTRKGAQSSIPSADESSMIYDRIVSSKN
ncbi:ribokinase [Petroclostridium sp. X23]|uniref:ribokinase n=1 Tax=Petroclostridium sp. X23 TaxID=3045146 RepID=UPI0024AD5779|nr:ribokinase [Petroclostridium sp. X23]WHH58549.1 ribokinase [Petroclostridium sp. X23]